MEEDAKGMSCLLLTLFSEELRANLRCTQVRTSGMEEEQEGGRTGRRKHMQEGQEGRAWIHDESAGMATDETDKTN